MCSPVGLIEWLTEWLDRLWIVIADNESWRWFSDLLHTMSLKFGWSEEVRKSINWPAMSTAMNWLPHRKCQLVKLLYDVLPTAHRTFEYDPKTSPLCPRCNTSEETVDQMFCCPCDDVKKWHFALFTSIRKSCLEKHHTRLILRALLDTGLDSWFRNMPAPDPLHYPESLQPLVVAQNQIGWQHLLSGRFAGQWATLQ
jgi:hypothetical protein